MFKAALFGSLLLVFSVMPSMAFAESHFEYAGIGLGNSDLKKAFPTSLVQNEEVWISEADSRDHVYYIRRTYMKDRTEIKIVLEKPEKFLKKKPQTWKEGHYARFPSCPDVLAKLERKYGKPAKEHSSWEERLKHRFRMWSIGSDNLELDCYQIDGKGKEVAAEITISRVDDR